MGFDDTPSEVPDWDPSQEIDPAKIQAEYLKVLKELVQYQKAENAKRRPLEQAVENELGEAPKLLAAQQPAMMAPIYDFPKPPSFEDVSDRMKRAWEETKRIAPDAPHAVQSQIFTSLAYATGGRSHGPPGVFAYGEGFA